MEPFPRDLESLVQAKRKIAVVETQDHWRTLLLNNAKSMGITPDSFTFFNTAGDLRASNVKNVGAILLGVPVLLEGDPEVQQTIEFARQEQARQKLPLPIVVFPTSSKYSQKTLTALYTLANEGIFVSVAFVGDAINTLQEDLIQINTDMQDSYYRSRMQQLLG